jgi:hypothetical protein
MKYSDSGDYCVLYLESGDDIYTLFDVIAKQQKQIVIMLAEHVRVFQRPEDFVALKHMKRRLSVGIVFVIEGSERLAQLANRHGFPVYSSMDALADALLLGHMGKQRTLNRTTTALNSGELSIEPQRTVPLEATSGSGEHHAVPGRTTPLGTARSSGEHHAVPGRTTPLGTARSSGEHYAAPKHTISLDSLREEHNVRGSAPVQETPLVSQPGESESIKTIPLPGKAPLTNTLPAPAIHAEDNVRSEEQELPPWVMDNAARPQEPEPWAIPLQAEQPRPSAPLPPLAVKQRRSHFSLALIALSMLAIALAGLGSELIFFNKLPTNVAAAPAAAAPAVVGQVRFLSSGQISENSAQGINDQVVVDLDDLPNPASGMSYYAWLLSDKNQADLKAILLGTLSLSNGHAHLFYQGDTQHTNLLLITSRFLVTEEDATVPPVSPSPDMSTWRYYGEFSQTPDMHDPEHFSYLDHLRHLLAADPTLDGLELPGGLNVWFYSNTAKILEWSNSMREQWEDAKDAGFVRRMAIRTLTYLDGLAFVQQDLPPNTPLLVNERLARIGLLNVAGPNQDPADYITHIDTHLNGLLQASPTPPTPAFRQQIADIVAQLDNIKSWLTQVRHDALLMIKMSDKQLQQPQTLNLINDMIANANYAYTGETDPNTGQMHQGVVWIHEHIQDLAVLNVAKFFQSLRRESNKVANRPASKANI